MVSDISSADQRRQLEMEKERLAHPWTKFQRDLDELYENSERYVFAWRLHDGHWLIIARLLIGYTGALWFRTALC